MTQRAQLGTEREVENRKDREWTEKERKNELVRGCKAERMEAWEKRQ